MNTEDTYDACLNSLQTTGVCETKNVLTANQCALFGIRKGFIVTVETRDHNLPRTYTICWEKMESDTHANNVVELRPRHVPFCGSEPTVPNPTDAAQAEFAARHTTPSSPLSPRRSIQPIPVEVARPSRFPRALAGFAAGTAAATFCTFAFDIHGWPNFFFGLTMPLIGSALGVVAWRNSNES